MLAEGETDAHPSTTTTAGGLTGQAAALAECEALEAACELAVARTEDQQQASSGQLALYRLKVLALRDRVRTYRALAFPAPAAPAASASSSSSSAPAAIAATTWAAFRRRPLREIAEDLASEGNVRGLGQVIREHPLSLSPAEVAALLALLPETLPPSAYQPLLPGLTQRPPQRPLDWAEAGQAPRWEGHWTPGALEDWYLRRAEEAEARGAPLASVVLELCDLGLARGAPEGGRLARLRAEVWHLSRLLYAGLLDGVALPAATTAGGSGGPLSVVTAPAEGPMTLARWRALPPRALVRTVLERAPLAYVEDPAALVRAVEAHLLPLVRGPDALLLLGSTGSGRGSDQASLESVLEEELTDFLASQIAEARAHRAALRLAARPRPSTDDAEDGDEEEEEDERQNEALSLADVACEVRLRAAVAVAQASKPNLPEAQRLLRRDAALFRLVLRCARAQDLATEPPGALDLLWGLVECLPVASAGAPREEQAGVDALEARLVAAQYLDSYGLGALPLSRYELFQAGAPHPPLAPAEADFRALARWEGGPADGGPPRRLDVEVVAGMCRHLAALRGTFSFKGLLACILICFYLPRHMHVCLIHRPCTPHNHHDDETHRRRGHARARLLGRRRRGPPRPTAAVPAAWAPGRRPRPALGTSPPLRDPPGHLPCPLIPATPAPAPDPRHAGGGDGRAPAPGAGAGGGGAAAGEGLGDRGGERAGHGRPARAGAAGGDALLVPAVGGGGAAAGGGAGGWVGMCGGVSR